MSELGLNRRAVAFLRDEHAHVENKISRLQNALDRCEDCLEGEGLGSMLDTARLERDVINDLLERQQGAQAVSLDATIMEHLQRLHESARRSALTWRRGQRTPARYWEAEMKQIALNDLLRRYHAWLQGENIYERHSVPDGSYHTTHPRRSGGNYAHPWYTLPGADHESETQSEAPPRKRRYSRSAEMLYEDIIEELNALEIPEHHLEIMPDPLGQVIVIGYMHDEAQKQEVIDTLLEVDGVYEVIEDIKVVAEKDCPPCRHIAVSVSEAEARRNGQHYRASRGNGHANRSRR